MKFLAVIGTLISSFLIKQVFTEPPSAPLTSTQLSSPNPIASMKTIFFLDRQYLYDRETVTDTSQLSLHSNLPDKLSSLYLYQNHSCRFLTSGGFYDKNHHHIGLFISNYDTIAPIQTNLLFNGFFSISSDFQPTISEYPPTDAKYVLQTGPILITDSQPLTLTIKNDKPARRLVAITDTFNQLHFIVIIDPHSTFQGPYLQSLPQLIISISQTENLKLLSAVNLDGGSASAYLTPLTTLTELNPIGSYFCVK